MIKNQRLVINEMGAKPLKEIINEFLKGRNFIEINSSISAQKAWEQTVGSIINEKTEIISYKKGILIIKATNPIWRNELSLQKQQILEKLQNLEPDLNIKEIILK